jgi:hypothetical protein
MKYETPELTASVPAINAIQSSGGSKINQVHPDSPQDPDQNPAYEDWE